jgi:hypothetical protein
MRIQERAQARLQAHGGDVVQTIHAINADLARAVHERKQFNLAHNLCKHDLSADERSLHGEKQVVLALDTIRTVEARLA